MIEGWETLLLPIPESVARFARAVTHAEFKALLSEFATTSWQAPLVARILEVYVVDKRSADYNQLLKVKHTSMQGDSMDDLKEKDPGSLPSSLICADCNTSWGNLPKCLLCKGTNTIDLSSTPMSVIEVDGQVWRNLGLATTLRRATWADLLRQQPLALTCRWSASLNRCRKLRESLSADPDLRPGRDLPSKGREAPNLGGTRWGPVRGHLPPKTH